MEAAGANTFTLWADIGCPWAHAAVFRWRKERARRGLEGEVHLDLRCFPLELINRRATPKITLDAEIPVAGSLAPEAGWQMWKGSPSNYPVSTLLAMESVVASKAQGPAAAEDLDFALRRAMFCESRNISLHHVIVEVAAACSGVDENAVERALETGAGRQTIFEDRARAEASDVKGSPHFFAPSGDNWHNPGVQIKWVGKSGGFPVIEKDDPGIYSEMFEAL